MTIARATGTTSNWSQPDHGYQGPIKKHLFNYNELTPWERKVMVRMSHFCGCTAKATVFIRLADATVKRLCLACFLEGRRRVGKEEKR